MSNEFHYVAQWSAEDAEFVGLCPEFPSLSWLAETKPGALDGIRQLVADVVADMKLNGEKIPLPKKL